MLRLERKFWGFESPLDPPRRSRQLDYLIKMTTQSAEYLVIKNLEFEIKRSDVDGKVFLALHKGKPVASAFDKALLKERIQANTKFWAQYGPKKTKSQFF